jgi:hypothetical protein
MRLVTIYFHWKRTASLPCCIRFVSYLSPFMECYITQDCHNNPVAWSAQIYIVQPWHTDLYCLAKKNLVKVYLCLWAPWRRMGEQRCSSTLSQPRHMMGLDNELHAPVPLPQGRTLGAQWVGPRKNSCCCRDLNPSAPRSSSCLPCHYTNLTIRGPQVLSYEFYF